MWILHEATFHVHLPSLLFLESQTLPTRQESKRFPKAQAGHLTVMVVFCLLPATNVCLVLTGIIGLLV